MKYINNNKNVIEQTEDSVTCYSTDSQKVQDFISNGGVIEPQYTEQELLNMEKANKISEARAYLASTDWYIIRYADNGKEVPSDIKIKREEARISIGGINE